MFASFMVNSWIAGTIIAILAGCVGFFVVLRGSTFAAHALPLGAFPGAAAASFLGIDPLWGLIVFSSLGALGIARLARRQRNDVATALTLIALLGLGALFLSLSGHYAQGVYALLFGQLISVSSAEILPIAVISLIVITAVCLFFRPLLITAVSHELSAAQTVSGQRMDLLFLALLALATAMALPAVGVLLVFSLMVGPAAAARSLTRRPVAAMALSILLALLTIWAAIALSYLSDWPLGFFVGAFAALLYGLAQGCKRIGLTRSRVGPTVTA